DEVRRPAVPPEEVFHFLMADTSQQGRVVDLIAVQMKNWEDGAIANGVQELTNVPGSCKRPCFGFPVSDYGRDYQVGIVEGGAAGMGKHIPQLTSFVD